MNLSKLNRYEVFNGRAQIATWGGYFLVAEVQRALEAQGTVTVTKDQAGRIVAVTRTDAEGRILEVIAESAPYPAPPPGTPPATARARLIDAPMEEVD